MADIPASVRVSYFVCPVESWNYRDAACENRFGDFDPNTYRIRVREDLEPAKAANVLLHEVLHAAYTMGDLSDGCTEEKVVTVLANQLTQIWRDNPEFITFMNDSLSIDSP
jgi:hypothetical protein